MHINEMTVGSGVSVIVTIGKEKLTFDTEVVQIDITEYKKYGYCVICKPIRVDGKLLGLTNHAVHVEINNVKDHRRYNFNLSALKYTREGKDYLLHLYSLEDIKPKNFRTAFRLECHYRVIMQLRGNKKECFTHDLSYTGGAYLFSKDSFPFAEKDHVTMTIFGDKDSKYVAKGMIVRVVPDFDKNYILIGVQFDGDVDIKKLINEVQMKELKRRQGKEKRDFKKL